MVPFWHVWDWDWCDYENRAHLSGGSHNSAAPTRTSGVTSAGADGTSATRRTAVHQHRPPAPLDVTGRQANGVCGEHAVESRSNRRTASDRDSGNADTDGH